MDKIVVVKDGSFYINGIRYAPKESESIERKQFNPIINGIIQMASAMYGEFSKYERKLPHGTDIVKEFELIQNKQSRLSKWERDMVVTIFEENYIKVT